DAEFTLPGGTSGDAAGALTADSSRGAFDTFDGLPGRIELGRARLSHRLAALGDLALDRTEAPHEARRGIVQRHLGPHLEVTREVHHREQEVAHLGVDPR